MKSPELFGGITDRIQAAINLSRIPSEGYQSTVGVYGYFFTKGKHGETVIATRRLGLNNLVATALSLVDRIGDPQLRKSENHALSPEVLEWMQRRYNDPTPRHFIEHILMRGKRGRGNPHEIVAHAQELAWTEIEGGEEIRVSLGDFYRLYPYGNGIEVTDPTIFTKGIALQDICQGAARFGGKEVPVDRMDAYAAAASYIGKVHKTSGKGIGEVLVSDIIFRQNESGAFSLDKPVLNLPDIIYKPRPAKKPYSFSDRLITPDSPAEPIPVKEQMATDMLDFLASVATEEYFAVRKEGGDPWQRVQLALQTVARSYTNAMGSDEIMRIVHSFAIRGRLTLSGDAEVIAAAKTEAGKKAAEIVNTKRRASGHLEIDTIVPEVTPQEWRGRYGTFGKIAAWFEPLHNIRRFGLDREKDLGKQRELVANLRRLIISTSNNATASSV